VTGRDRECDCPGRCDEPGYSAITGHRTGCPAHREILSHYDPDAAAGSGLPEDRGTPAWVWVHDATARWEPFPAAELVVEVSVPIGWRLAPDPACGAALVHTCGARLTSGQAWGLAAAGRQGFRVRATARP
jgi:hypothetical protein